MEQNISTAPLTDLYQLVADSVKGYWEASTKVKTPQLASFLSDLSSARMEMKLKLAEAIHRWQPDEKLDEGTVKGDLHRAWIQVREALSASTDGSVLDECDRGEDYLEKRYNSVLEDNDTPRELHLLLREQASKIAVTRSTIKELRKTGSNADE